MSSDKLFQKRRAKQPKDLARRKASRNGAPRILIVTEGERTEPEYFGDLIVSKRLSTANVVVDGNCGSDPMSVYRHAKELYEKEKSQGGRYDRVYCVFDKDKHTTYLGALDAIRRSSPSRVFHAINSVPCFEYWLILHYKDCAKPYVAPEGSSACELLMRDFPPELSNYRKGQKGLYGMLRSRTEEAIKRATSRLAQSDKLGQDNPSTKVHILVQDLYALEK